MSQAVSVTYAPAGNKALDFQHVVTTDLPFEDVLQRVRTAIEDSGLWPLHEINPQELLIRGGFRIRPARQFLFFHPRFMARILNNDPSALLEAPLKIAVVESPTGRVMLRWYDPVTAFERYGNGELTDLGGELGQICRSIVERAVPTNAAA